MPITENEISWLRQSLRSTLNNLNSLEALPDNEMEKELFLETAHETIALLQSITNKLT
jgi:hypothetical protein